MKKIDVACAVIKTGRKFLVAKRSNEPDKGLWEFPGGKVQYGETLFEATVREIREELHINIVPTEELVSYEIQSTEKKYILHFILAEFHSGDIKLDEHSESRWLDKSELPLLNFVEGDQKFLLLDLL